MAKEKEKDPVKYGLDHVTGTLMVFENKNGFSVTISGKNKDDEYVNVFVPVYFSKKCKVSKLENKDTIKVTEGWFKAQQPKKGEPYISLFVNECEVL